MTGQLIRRAAAFVALALVVAGCGGSADEPTVLEPPSSSATPTNNAAGSPTPTADITSGTPESALAFTRYYFDVLSYAYRTGDDSQLAALSAPTCETCTSYLMRIRDVYSDGGHISGAQVTVLDTSASTGSSLSEFPVDVKAAITDYSAIGSAGDVIASEPGAEDVLLRVTLADTPNSWQVLKVQPVVAGEE